MRPEVSQLLYVSAREVSMERNQVVLVDQYDQEVGEMDKLLAHQRGELHRAFSIFIFNKAGQMLIHQRAAKKYHGGGLWTNACCSHPQKGEDLKSAAKERLGFEMGLVCDVERIFSFVYHSPVENGLIEHEYDHVFVGYTDVEPQPNPAEVQDYQWISLEELQQKIEQSPEQFTYWFKSALTRVIAALER
ncbi:isopentenyl-diphosphate Delta-isomerase [Sphingobacterium sp. lm-10]|uniref:isopentenyl-diphosphate Delta-isomerase n=1 Tax=Sphingobacterium sp. lm-10 TaxID=2944904 RepID=UPI0020203C24|nr:isopentenyl-diphosphate Delta-isomerase [Sphingobacterium sp. lm-10]MCL7986900.1 isopentenyl-diphosphate Delta-isomerase [Sphingobacterium sp. lm-10]